jgi:outer membrane protein OmpA-like peptidoglycan-associated protein/tetratricopeptide (TPR) repeat protein
MKILLFLVLVCAALALNAQDRQYSTNNKEALQFYNLARQNLDYQLYTEASEQLTKAVEADPNFIEAQNQLADVLRITKKYRASSEHYLKVISINPEFNRAIYYNLAQAELSLAEYAAAQVHLKKYLQYPNIDPGRKLFAALLIKDCIFAIEAVKSPVAFKPVNMGPEINTTDDEYLPVLTADENLLIFTRKINQNEDFYKSARQNGKWTRSVYLSKQINTPEFNEGAQSVTQDGKYLFFTGCDRPGGYGQCDIYVSQKMDDDWEKPVNLGPPVNTRSWESQPSISADGNTLYFVSNRKGGYGGYDIWKSTLTKTGWSEPENLGPNVNTPYDEQSPFIHPDDNTLYFASNGWPGMGNLDLFVSRRDNSGKWQKPVNLGYPINTSGDDTGLSINAAGTQAFFSSNNIKGYGGYDIYSFEMPAASRPLPVTYVAGTVKDAQSKQPLEASVAITELATNKPVYNGSSTADAGYFLATLTENKNYGLQISKTGYLFHSENFMPHGHGTAKPFQLDVLLQPISVGNKVVLNNIFFDTNKTTIKDESKSELQKLIDFLNQNPTIKIEISGHTDNVGQVVFNQTLSENRARAVYQYLTAAQIAPSRLSYKGYGKTQPIAPNTTEEGRMQNRRTEFKVTAN